MVSRRCPGAADAKRGTPGPAAGRFGRRASPAEGRLAGRAGPAAGRGHHPGARRSGSAPEL